jgi:hypothetical protein
VWYYGVYPNAAAGHTNAYRSGLLDLANAGTTTDFVLSGAAATGAVCKFNPSSHVANGVTYHQIAKETLISAVFEENASNCKIYPQKGAKYSYYGRRSGALTDGDANMFLQDPQVFLPAEYDSLRGKIYDFQIPDFVVCVVIDYTFDDDEGVARRGIFSKRFLPKVQTISGSAVSAKKTELQAYVAKCSNGTAINNLANNNAIPVKHPAGAKGVAKSINTLTQIGY